AITDRSAPVLCFGTLASRFSPLELLPWHQSDWFLQFRAKACIQFTPPLRRPSSAQSSGTRQTYPRRATRFWFCRRLQRDEFLPHSLSRLRIEGRSPAIVEPNIAASGPAELLKPLAERAEPSLCFWIVL